MLKGTAHSEGGVDLLPLVSVRIGYQHFREGAKLWVGEQQRIPEGAERIVSAQLLAQRLQVWIIDWVAGKSLQVLRFVV